MDVPSLLVYSLPLVLLSAHKLGVRRGRRSGYRKRLASTYTNPSTGTSPTLRMGAASSFFSPPGGLSEARGFPLTRHRSSNGCGPISFGSATATPGANGAPRASAGYDEAA